MTTHHEPMSFLQNNSSKEARIPYGSRKEFQFSVLEQNYTLDNAELAVILGCCYSHVGRLKKDWCESGRMAIFVVNEFMRFHRSEIIPHVDKYHAMEKLLLKLIDLGLVLPAKDGRVQPVLVKNH